MTRYKYNIVIDKLEISYSASEEWKAHFEDVGKDHTESRDQLVLKRNESTIYTNEYDVRCFIDGHEQSIGLLYWGSPNQYRQRIYFSYCNKALYNDFLLASRFYIEEALGLTFERISKLDIAIDSNLNVVKRFYKYLRNADYDLILNGTKESNMDEYITDIEGSYSGSRKNPYKHKTFYVHNRDRTLEIRGYNKSLEIAEKSGKEYIERNAGFGGLYRLEVACKNHKQIMKTLHDLGIIYEEDLYAKLQLEEFLLLLFENFSRRLIRFTYKRKSYSLTDLFFD